jgi:hypothetical protein
MKDYNGFSDKERQALYNQQKAAGMIDALPQVCCVCQGHGGLIMGHTENYHDINDLREICIECHMKLHGRFSRPGIWIKHLLDLKEGKQPVQWKSVIQYFAGQDNKRHSEFANIDPSTIGNEWYHQLKMHKINIKDAVQPGTHNEH